METDRKIIDYESLVKLKQDNSDKKIVLTTGCYDILHLGHVVHFNYCRSRGDLLVVSVGNDKNVHELKGEGRPINSEKTRSRMVAALECVDNVIISREMGIMDHDELVSLLKPDVYVVPMTDSHLEEKRKLIEEVHGKFVTCRRIPPVGAEGISSTSLAKKIKE